MIVPLFQFSALAIWVMTALAVPCSRYSSCKLDTSSGVVFGSSENGVRSFLSIPYAKAERFHAPQPVQHPRNNLPVNSNQLPPFCPQDSSYQPQDENCLFLNVYAPSGKRKLPVMVWVHGGSFMSGGSADPSIIPTAFVSNQDVIVVTFNYRLGALGFFNSPQTGANAGVQDAMAAFTWVKKNIKLFGGDPDNITAFGQSSGATMIRLLLTAQHTGFDKAILQSDPMAFDGSTNDFSRNISLAVSSAINCSIYDKKCLSKASVESIVTASSSIDSVRVEKFPDSGSLVYDFGPTIDGRIFKETFYDALVVQGKQIRQPLIIGTVQNEAADLVPESSWPALKTFEQLGTNLVWQCSNICNSNLIGHVYEYIFTTGELFFTSDSACDDASNNLVCHQSDIAPLFGSFGYFNLTESREVKKFGQQIQSRWASFARSSNPNTGSYSKWSQTPPPLSIGQSKAKVYGCDCQEYFHQTRNQLGALMGAYM
ncbi:hypothetical protein TRVA0_041S00320 [Trichomonascus vanleenenianus]|uniref:uncharacterized protein n=1 Tax=Trichomonascus vanleenenianus TaxID=2268995 RepID=UPI003ECB06EC